MNRSFLRFILFSMLTLGFVASFALAGGQIGDSFTLKKKTSRNLIEGLSQGGIWDHVDCMTELDGYLYVHENLTNNIYKIAIESNGGLGRYQRVGSRNAVWNDVISLVGLNHQLYVLQKSSKNVYGVDPRNGNYRIIGKAALWNNATRMVAGGNKLYIHQTTKDIYSLDPNSGRYDMRGKPAIWNDVNCMAGNPGESEVFVHQTTSKNI